MVAGLVENQQIGIRLQRAKQGNAAAFPAAQLRRRRLYIEVAEALLMQGSLQPLDQVPAPFEALDIVLMRLTTHDPLHGIEPVCATRQVDDTGVGGGHDALRQVGDTPLSHDTPLAGLQVTGQQAAEHRLANAIASDQTRVTVIEYFAEPLEQHDAIGKAKRNALERDMRGIGHPCLQAMP